MGVTLAACTHETPRVASSGLPSRPTRWHSRWKARERRVQLQEAALRSAMVLTPLTPAAACLTGSPPLPTPCRWTPVVLQMAGAVPPGVLKVMPLEFTPTVACNDPRLPKALQTM